MEQPMQRPRSVKATWYVQMDEQADIAICVREYMAKRVAGEASRSLYVKILIYHGKKLLLIL